MTCFKWLLQVVYKNVTYWGSVFLQHCHIWGWNEASLLHRPKNFCYNSHAPKLLLQLTRSLIRTRFIINHLEQIAFLCTAPDVGTREMFLFQLKTKKIIFGTILGPTANVMKLFFGVDTTQSQSNSWRNMPPGS